MNPRSFRKSIIGTVAFGALAMSGSAFAQDADTEEAVTEVVTAPAEDEARQEKIVVTGSLLARSEFTSASPIQVITAEVATLEGLVDTASLLQGSSLAAGSTQLNNTFQNFVTNGGVGSQTIDLRGCGDTRTLVLIDGKRPGPSGTRGAVAALDLNVLPQSIISRIEILKDGASTIYGSDAVCGVVNIITRDSIESPELTFNVSQPFEQGGEEYRVNGAFGFGLGDNAQFTLSGEYRFSDQLSISDRDYLECPQDYVKDPETGELIDRLNFSATARDPRDRCNTLYHNTVIDLFTGQRLIPSPDGVTRPTRFGSSLPGYRPRVGTGFTADGLPFYEDILQAPFVNNRDVIPENENIAVFATADIEFSGIEWDTELLLTKRKTDVEGWRQFFPIVGSAETPFGNIPSYGYISDPTYSNDLETLAQIVAPFPTTTNIEVDYAYLSSSLSGGFGTGFLNDWSWKVDGTYSKGEGSYGGNLIQITKSGDWGLDGVADTNGDGNPDLVAPPSINLLDPCVLSGECVDDLVAAVGAYQVGTTEYEQTTFTAVVAGELFDLPAGPIGLGLGFEYRDFSINDQPGEFTQLGDVWGSTTAGPTVGSNDVSEVFAEINVPLLKGQPFAEDVELSASGRAFDYKLGGSDSIYKVGLNWQVNPIIRARSSYGTSYRAPALFELFLQDQTGFASQLQVDPCINWADSQNTNVRTNCAAAGIPDNFAGASSSATIIESGGGELLLPETGTTFTAGLVFTPTWADLNIALDYYEIELQDQITSLSGAQIVGGCYASPVFPNDFCDLFTRNSATDPTAPFKVDDILAPTLNVDAQNQRGIDLEARYTRELNIGELTIEGSVSWSLERFINVFGSDFLSGVSDNDFNGTLGFPSVVGDVSARLDRGDWTYTWFSDFTGRQDNNRNFAQDFNEPFNYNGRLGLRTVNTEATMYHGASVRWRGDSWSVTGGIRNIFGEEPPLVSSNVTRLAGNVSVEATGYDIRGRRLFVTVSKTF